MAEPLALTEDFDFDPNLVTGEISIPEEQITDEDIREFNSKRKLILKRSWLSLGRHLMLFVLAVALGSVLSTHLPSSVYVWSMAFSDYKLMVSVPFSMLFPFMILAHGWWKINDRYVELDKNILYLHKGCLSLNRQTVEMETETLLVVQCSQTAWERLLGLGTVSVGRFSRRALELSMPGIRNPNELVRKLKKRIILARKVKAKTAS